MGVRRFLMAIAAASAAVTVTAADFRVTGNTGAAIQTAIDAAAAAGGGRVVVPAGTYPTGSLTLKSHVELHLEKGALVQGSTNYHEWGSFPESAMPKMYRALLHAWDAENIALTGEGVFDGNGMSFFDKDQRIFGRFYKGVPARPKLLIFVRCKDARFEGPSFLNPPSWTMHFIACENLLFRRIKVLNDLMCINCDGINLDGCRHVRVDDCDFRTGDDSIAIRSILWPGGAKRVITEDIVVENSRFESACQCLRIGCPSDDTIRDIHFRNLTFKGFNGVSFDYPENYLIATDEGYLDAHNITFENITGKLDYYPIRIAVAPGVKLRGIRDVLFRNVNLTSVKPLLVRGNYFSRLERIRFENVAFNDERQPDGTLTIDFTNRTALQRTKPGEYNYKKPVSYVPQLYVSPDEATGASVQAAIDTVATNATGGVVTVPAGTYVCGSIRLPGRVELRLEQDVTLKIADRLVSENAEKVALVGPGMIELTQAAVFCGCREVRLDGVTLSATAGAELLLRDCADVSVDGVTARAIFENCREVRGANNSFKIP